MGRNDAGAVVLKTSLACAFVLILAALPAWAESSAPVLSGIVLTTDRTVDATSNQAIAKSIWKAGMNEQQKAYTMWRFFIQHNMHRELDYSVDDGGNAAEVFTKAGYAICGNWAGFFAGCMADNGMTATRVFLNGHVVNAVRYWGEWHTYDTDMWNIYCRANGLPVAPSEIKGLTEPAPGVPPVKSYPWYIGTTDTILGCQNCYRNTNVGAPEQPQPNRKWVYNLSLRPGQEIVWSWYGDPDVGFVSLSHLPDQMTKKPYKTLREYLASDFDYYKQTDGKPKWNWGYKRGGLHNYAAMSWAANGGNGRLTMDAGAEGFKNALAMAAAAENVEVKDGKLALKDAAKEGSLTLDFNLPYLYGDAWVEKPLPKGIKLLVNNLEVYPNGAGVDDGQRIRLFELVRGKSGFALKILLEANSAPLEKLKAVGAFHLNHTVLPAVLKGKNQVSVRLSDSKLLAGCPLHVTYVYDQVSDDKKINRIEKVLSFTPGALTQELNTGDTHWPLMREIRMRCGGAAPQAAAMTEEKDQLDWSASPWDWAFYGVNFWNDFERGDRQGWEGRLTTKNTFNGSDFALDNSLLNPDGTRQLKILRGGAFLNRDTKFRCQLWVKNVSKINFYTKNTAEKDDAYYGKLYDGFRDGVWQPFEVSMNDLANKKGTKIQNNWYLGSVYIKAIPAEGKAEKDVEFMIDNVVCYDGALKNDPCADADAAQKALADDPIWNAKKPETSK